MSLVAVKVNWNTTSPLNLYSRLFEIVPLLTENVPEDFVKLLIHDKLSLWIYQEHQGIIGSIVGCFGVMHSSIVVHHYFETV